MEPQEVVSEIEERFEKIKKLIGIFLGPIIFVIIYLIPIPDLTAKAHKLVAVLSLVIIWWIFEPIPIPVTGLLGVSLVVILGIEDVKKRSLPLLTL
ncbi:MAG: anion permease [Candidatus Hydrothermales bacterium]